jgi:phosphate-selective porin OprO/OprP
VKRLTARQTVHKNRRFYAVIVGLMLPATFARAQDVPPPAAPGVEAPPPPAALPPEAPPPGAAAPAPAAPPPAAPDLQVRIDEIDQRARIAERKLELAEEAAAARAKETPSVTAEEAGFGIASPDKRYQLRIRGLVQVDVRRFFGDDTQRDKDTFLLRRVRPTIEVTLLGLADARITPDFAGGTTQLYDVYIDVHPRPWLRLRAGKFKPPVGLERLQSDGDLVFTERALDQNLTAQRDIGVQLWGDVAGGLVRYEAAVLNGVPDFGLNDTDIDYSKSFAGRLLVQPFAWEPLRWLGRLGVGIAAETGYEKGSSAIVNGAVPNSWLGSFRTAGQNTVFAYNASTTDATQTVIAFNRHTRVNPQLYYYFQGFGLEAEYVREYQELDRGGDSAAVNNSAGHVTGAFVVGGDRTFEGPRVHHPFNLATGDLGALEVGVRYNWLTIDDVAFQGLADATKSVAKAQGWGVALSWYLAKSLRAAVSYDQTSFTGGAKRGTATADRNTEKILIGRLQVGY